MNDESKPHVLSARISWFMQQSGLAELNQLHPLEHVASCLSKLAQLICNEDAQTIHFVQHAAATCLKSAGVEGATKLVQMSLPRAQPKPAHSAPAPGSLRADLEPWDDAIDLSALLGELQVAIRRYVALEDCEAAAIALWVVHTHSIDAAQYTPRLAILSPTKRCGKSTLMKVLASLVHRPLAAANISAPALFRVIERYHPTLLIDEADTFLADNEQMRGVLNAGHDRSGGGVFRVDVAERGHDLLEFQPFGAVAIALIGSLPSTLADRAITIRLKRCSKDSAPQKFRRPQAEALVVLARKCMRWALDNVDALWAAPHFDLAQLDARAADNWESLFSIARAAGAKWFRRATVAAETLSTRARERERNDDVSERLLFDIRTLVVDGRMDDRVSMKQLCDDLSRIDDAPWATFCNGRRLNTVMLGKLLRAFEIAPDTIRFKHGPIAKGYTRAAFQNAFDRYLPPAPVTTVTAAEPLHNHGSEDELPKNHVTEPDLARNLNGRGYVTDVTVGRPPINVLSARAGDGGE